MSTEEPRLDALPNPEAVAMSAAAVVLEQARATVQARGAFNFAVSGGRTPWAMFAQLAHEDFPWSDTAVFQVDERIAPEGDPSRNLTHLKESLPAAAIDRVCAMPVNDPDLDTAARDYERSLPERFDLIHLGLGPDGHTASLVPGDPVLDVVDRDVALTQPYQQHRRMTITYSVIDRARMLLWLVTGSDKTEALRGLRHRDRSIPAGRVTNGHAVILADTAAAG